MATTDISAQRLRELLHYDQESGVFTRLVSTAQRVHVGTTIDVRPGQYGRVQLDGRRYKLHRLAFLYLTGEWPTHEVDHINGEPSDNRFSNLRDVTHVINVQNKRRPFASNASGFLGVSQAKLTGRWIAGMRHNGATVHIGCFGTPEEAHQAYLAKKRELHAGCTL